MRQVPDYNNKYYYRQLISLFILIIIDELGTWILLPVLAPLVTATSQNILGHTANSELRHLLFGIIVAISPLCAIIGAPLLGFISDQMGRKKVLLICLAGTFLGFILYTLSFWYMNLLLLIGARIVVGLTTASQGIVQACVADLSTGKQKAINISTIACAMTIPLIIGPLLGGYLSDPTLVSWFNRATPFIFVSLLSLLNLILLAFSFKETLVTTNRYNSSKNYWPVISTIFAQAELKRLLSAFFLMELGWSLYFQSIPLVLAQKWFFNSAQIGLFNSYIGSYMALALIILPRFTVHLFNANKILRANLLIVAIALLFEVIVPKLAILWLVAIPTAVGTGLGYTFLITSLSDHVTADSQGLLMGITDALMYLAFACTGFLAGLLTAFSTQLVLLIASLFIFASYCINRWPYANKPTPQLVSQ